MATEEAAGGSLLVQQSQREDATAHEGGPTALPFPSWEALMRDRGYCPHQIKHLDDVFWDDSERNIFAALDRRVARPESHQACESQPNCIAYNSPIDKHYQTQHTAECVVERCYTVEIPQSDLQNIIRSGGVPLVSIRETRKGRLSLRVKRRGFRTRYATVSHVWADGLGNPIQNALPSCQIQRLQKLFAEHKRQKRMDKMIYDIVPFASDPQGWLRSDWFIPSRRCMRMVDDWVFWSGDSDELFWMDTLCIPVDDSCKELRTRCIDTMSSIYASSSPVFVLDKELMATSKADNHDDFQRLYNIACSVWMTRSWTLQEAILPADCVFDFADRLYQPTADLKVCQSLENAEHYDNGHYGIVKFMFDDFLNFRRGVIHAEAPPPEHLDPSTMQAQQDARIFFATWNALAVRNTTEAADLWVVLASCLGIKHRQFGQLAVDQKMQHILFSFQKLPLSLFFNVGPKMNAVGRHHNRWVPKQVSRHLMTKSPMVTFPSPGISKHSDQEAHMELVLSGEGGENTHAVLVDCVIPKECEFNLLIRDELYRIIPILDADDQFQLDQCIATCIMYERWSSSTEPRRNAHGAWFYVTAFHDVSDDEQAMTLVELIYLCPVKLDPIQESGSYTAYKHRNLRDDRYKFWIKYDPIPGFVPLKRQNMQPQFSEEFAKKTVIPLYWTFLGLDILLVFGMVIEMIVMDNSKLTRFYHFIESRIYDKEKKINDDNFEMWQILSMLIFSLLSLLILASPLVIIPFVATILLRIRDYIFLYQSYDDEAFGDRFSRLLDVALQQFRETLLRLLGRTSLNFVDNSQHEEPGERLHNEQTDEQERQQRQEQRNQLWKQRRRRAALMGRRAGKKSLQFLQQRVLPIAIWPFKAIIEGADALNSWQDRHSNRRRHDRDGGVMLLSDYQDSDDDEDQADAQPTRISERRSAAELGWDYGQQSWNFIHKRVIPIVIWPFEVMITSVDSLSRWQTGYDRRRAARSGPIHL